MTIGILQPSYLPWLGVFEQMARADTFVFYDDVQYTKNDWRNRNRIKTPHGVKWLTVPVLTSGQFGSRIMDIKIDDTKNWKRDHLGTIKFAYNKAPYFDAYFPPLAKIIENAGDKLCDLNIELILFLAASLGIKTKFLRVSSLAIPTAEKNQRLIEVCHRLGADSFYEGAAGADYIDVLLFAKGGIKITFQDYQHPVYNQMHGSFVSHLSIIDILFNEGPKSLNLILGK